MILQELHKLQHHHGYLPEAELKSLAKKLEQPLYRLHEVASFYPHFRFEAGAPVEVRVCRDMSCYHRGATKLHLELQSRCKDLVDQGKVHVDGVSCLGRCDRAPMLTINEQLMARRRVDETVQAIRDAAAGKPIPADTDEAYTACNPTPWEVDPYADGSAEIYEAARRLMSEMDRAEPGNDAPIRKVLDSLTTAGLRGMGGAGEPTGSKWGDVLAAPGETKYVVCNADESEPATFKDRELLLRKPHLIIEGMIIAGLIFGAKQGWIYVRHEYPEQIARLKEAIRLAERQGVCGSIMRSPGRSFQLDVYTSPGGYICGEQSALIEAMEDHRSEPRNRPPTLATNGLFDCPTLVNNVETFAWVPSILQRGGEWYRDAGVNGAKGRRFFSISGDVNRPGVYEVPAGVKVGEFIEEYAQGMRDGELRAFAPSGPSGGFLPKIIPLSTLPSRAAQSVAEGSLDVDLYDLPMDLDAFRGYGLMLGAGVVAYGPRTKIVREAVNATEFFRNESCGKCVPCRIGSQKLVEIGGRLIDRQYVPGTFNSEEALIRELSRAMEQTSICGLGAVAANPVTTLVRYFREEVESYLSQKKG